MLISIRNVSKQYGKKVVLQDVSLEIREGEMFGLAGENGAGKSTLLSIVAAVLQPDSGDVLFECQSIYQRGEGIKML